MGGVDKAGMLCALHGIGRKSRKWWHRIFFGLIDRTITITNHSQCIRYLFPTDSKVFFDIFLLDGDVVSFNLSASIKSGKTSTCYAVPEPEVLKPGGMGGYIPQ